MDFWHGPAWLLFLFQARYLVVEVFTECWYSAIAWTSYGTCKPRYAVDKGAKQKTSFSVCRFFQFDTVNHLGVLVQHLRCLCKTCFHSAAMHQCLLTVQTHDCICCFLAE